MGNDNVSVITEDAEFLEFVSLLNKIYLVAPTWSPKACANWKTLFFRHLPDIQKWCSGLVVCRRHDQMLGGGAIVKHVGGSELLK